MREGTEVFERVLDLRSEVLEHRVRVVGSGGGQLARQTQVHGQRDEALLSAVVKVALDLAAFRVGGGNDARSRRLQLGRLLADLVE